MQVTQAIATGPRPPATFPNTNDESRSSVPTISIGDGMGKHIPQLQCGLGLLEKCISVLVAPGGYTLTVCVAGREGWLEILPSSPESLLPLQGEATQTPVQSCAG